MRKMEVNGRTVSTNYGEDGMFAMHSGNPGKTQRVETPRKGESDEEFLERLAGYGYKTIRFAQTSTRVVGWHQTIALCRR